MTVAQEPTQKTFAAGKARVEVQLLGEFSVSVDGVAVPPWQAGKARALFHYLILERGRAVSRDTLQDVLWPDTALCAGSSSLRVAVYTLRRILVDAGPEVAAALRLESALNGYRLHVDGAWVDVFAFEDAVAEAAAARRAHKPGKALAWQRAAAALYQGDLLPEENTPWIELRRHGLRSAVLTALDAQLKAAVECDDGPEVVQIARTILSVDPHDESAYQALIRQHGRMGQPHQADRWFVLCTTQLRIDLDVGPDGATRRVHRQALDGALTRPNLRAAS